MVKPSVLVLRAAGINCDRETAFAFEQAGATTKTLHINELLKNPGHLPNHGLVVIPGGFSYGDDVSAGRVMGLELSENLGDQLRDFLSRGGLILGICNGFQVLVKAGLLPGGEKNSPPVAATLTWNDSHRYEDRWVHLRVEKSRSLFSPKGQSIINLPVAHGEGRFTTAKASEIQSLEMAEQIVFRYVNADGSKPTYPANPNGSVGDVAGICDPTGQVLGLMPHPERALFPWHHPDWSRQTRAVGDGASLFGAAIAAMR